MPVPHRSTPWEKAMRAVAHPGDNPEVAAIRNQVTPENQESRRRQEEGANMEECARALIELELAALRPREKGLLAAYWIDVCRYDAEETARALFFAVDTAAARVAKLRALRRHPCAGCPDSCGPGCAHGLGESLWKSIVQRILSTL